MHWLKLTVSVAVLVVLAWNHDATAQGNGAMLAESLETGTIRTVVHNAASDLAVTNAPGTNWATTTNSKQQRRYATEEWAAKVEGGRAVEVTRAYLDVSGKDTQYIVLNEGPQAFETPTLDWKNHHVFRMAVAADGSRKITHEFWDTIEAKDQKFIVKDTDPNPLPGRKVTVGESWTPAGTSLGLFAFSDGITQLKSCDIKFTLDSVVGTKRGHQVANLSAAGSATFYREEINPYDDAASTRLTATATLSGNGTFDVTTGQMLALAYKGKTSVTGKLNGADISAEANFEESWQFSYGSLIDANSDNGNTPAEAVEGYKAYPFGALAENQVLIGRNDGKYTRVQVVDLETRKIVATVLTMKADATIRDLAVSPDRKSVAFASSLNGLLSIAETNVFVLNLVTGKLDQISPFWAPGDGLGQALKTAKTTTVKGRIKWYDDDPDVRTDRFDGFTGRVHVDHTACLAIVKNDGSFELTGVPVGASLLLDIQGTLPSTYRNGKIRGGTDALARYAGATFVDITFEEGVRDLGDIRISGHKLATGYCRPGWRGDIISIQQDGWTYTFDAGYPKHSWAEVKSGLGLQHLTGGHSVSPDGKLVAFANNENIAWFCKPDGTKVFEAKSAGANLGFDAEGAWLVDGSGWVCTASSEAWHRKLISGMPAICYVGMGDKQGRTIRQWGCLVGHKMVSLAVDKAGDRAIFVTHRFDVDKLVTWGDAWVWQASTDSCVRLTALGDVVCVGGYGR
ncbi:MAG: hypothetical protein IPP14_08945 [Planctomycetes bacterium]|nr:hypothetical protein [Planctomycetota bacterium]